MVARMTMSAESVWLAAVEETLAGSHLWQPDQFADRIDAAVGLVGGRATVYQINHEQVLLRPLPVTGRPTPAPLAVEGTAAGRAFISASTVQAGADRRWWVPIVNGTDRLGTVEFLLDDGPVSRDPRLVARLEMFAGLTGHLLTTTEPRGDHLQRMRRSRPMSTAAELLLTVLPPLTASTAELVVSAVLEPCYEVGGDGYDYALDGSRPQIVVLDAVGRGLKAGLACVVVVSALRAARRAGLDLVEQARAADIALQEQFPDSRFATAVLAELDVDTGALRYVNAGHPPPLLLRGGRFVRELSGGRRMPLGIDDDVSEVGTEELEPGDRLLVYTDGVTEARDAHGEPFGLERLQELTQRHAGDGLPAPETLRRLSLAVAAHQEAPPIDDATLLLLEWSRTSVTLVVPDSTAPATRSDLRSTTGSSS
jgi:hypothetical protein